MAAQSQDEVEVEEGAGWGCGSKVEATQCANRLKEKRANKCARGECSQGGQRGEAGIELGRTRSWLLEDQGPLSKDRHEDFPEQREDFKPSRPGVHVCSLSPLDDLGQQSLSSQVGPHPPA